MVEALRDVDRYVSGIDRCFERHAKGGHQPHGLSIRLEPT